MNYIWNSKTLYNYHIDCVRLAPVEFIYDKVYTYYYYKNLKK